MTKQNYNPEVDEYSIDEDFMDKINCSDQTLHKLKADRRKDYRDNKQKQRKKSGFR